jgi:molybdopterin converting factor small subunit
VSTTPVEIVGWPTRFVGGDGAARRLFEEPLPPGTTVRSLLNDAVLGVAHDLDSKLQPGDRVMLLAQFMGGR